MFADLLLALNNPATSQLRNVPAAIFLAPPCLAHRHLHTYPICTEKGRTQLVHVMLTLKPAALSASGRAATSGGKVNLRRTSWAVSVRTTASALMIHR
eukprot:950900-Pleurochrysis_carterae.AAC.4